MQGLFCWSRFNLKLILHDLAVLTKINFLYFLHHIILD